LGCQEQPALEASGEQIRGEADQRVEHDDQHHDVGLQELARVGGEHADARRGADALGGDQRQPRGGEPEAHAVQDRGQRAGQDRRAHQGQTADPEHAAHLDQLRIDLSDAEHRVQVQGKEAGESHEEDLADLAHAEPHEDER